VARPLDPRLLRESRAARRHLILATALGMLGALAILAQASLLAYVIDRAALHRATLSELRGELLALGAVLLLRAAVDGGFELSARLGARGVMSDLRGRLAARLLRADGRARPAGERAGEIAAAAVQGIDALEGYFAGYLPQLVLAATVPLAVLVYAGIEDPPAAAVLALTVPILIAFMVLVGKSARAQTERRWRALSLLSAHFLDVVRGLATLRAHRREGAQARTLAAVGERYRAETMGTLRIAFVSALVLELCATLGTAMVAATIGVQLAAGSLGLTAGLAVLLLAPELYGPLRLVGAQFHAAAEGTAAAGRIFELLDAPSALADGRSAPAVSPAVPDPAREPVRFEHVTYEYPERAERAALHDVELELAPGEITALVGPSGAGKSTIARLAMRLADPSAGRVTCGGMDLRALDVERWREQVAWVPQRPTLFAGTVAENIALGVPSAGEKTLFEAARRADALEFIERLPQGMGTRVGEGGRRLSAGERQRIALARALVRGARLLVLDEPTAHLDETSAARIAALLPQIAQGRTVLLIVHHPALCEHAHRVVRMRAGRVCALDDERVGAPA